LVCGKKGALEAIPEGGDPFFCSKGRPMSKEGTAQVEGKNGQATNQGKWGRKGSLFSTLEGGTWFRHMREGKVKVLPKGKTLTPLLRKKGKTGERISLEKEGI